MYWSPEPSLTIVQSSGGTGNMGTFPVDASGYSVDGIVTTKLGRFYLESPTWCLVFARVHFFGGTGTATLYLYVDSRLGRNFDTNLWQVSSAGTTGNDAFLRILPGEFPHWTYPQGDELVFTWTNPDSGNMAWGIEVGLCDASG